MDRHGKPSRSDGAVPCGRTPSGIRPRRPSKDGSPVCAAQAPGHACGQVRQVRQVRRVTTRGAVAAGARRRCEVGCGGRRLVRDGAVAQSGGSEAGRGAGRRAGRRGGQVARHVPTPPEQPPDTCKAAPPGYLLAGPACRLPRPLNKGGPLRKPGRVNSAGFHVRASRTASRSERSAPPISFPERAVAARQHASAAGCRAMPGPPTASRPSAGGRQAATRTPCAWCGVLPDSAGEGGCPVDPSSLHNPFSAHGHGLGSAPWV